ncbi:MAG: hypothetical protein ACRDTQ_04905 [Micromonosporaceae bacterium]
MIASHAVTLASGIALGAVAGWHAQRAVRAWADYRAVKAQLPGLLAAARRLTRHAAGVVLVAAFRVAAALYLAGTTHD